jgi:hypothetical protein
MKKWNGPLHEPEFFCGAHTRSTGKPCKRFAMSNGRRDMHGGMEKYKGEFIKT